MKHFLGLIPRYIKGQKARSLLTAAGLTLAVALVSGASIIGSSLSASYLDYVTKANGSWHASYSELDSGQVSVLASHAYVEKAGIIRSLGVSRLADKGLAIKAAEYDEAALELSNISLIQGELPDRAGEIALEQWILAEMGLDNQVGRQINLAFDTGPEQIYTLTGILGNLAMSQVSGYSAAVVGGNAQGQFQVLTRFGEQYARRSAGQAIMDQLDLEESQVRFNESLFMALEDTSQGSIYLLLGLAVLAATVAAIHNILHISVLERIQQYGMLRALGTGPRQIRRMVLGEGLVLATAAIPMGLLLGIFGTWGLVLVLSSEITTIRVPFWTILWASTICLAAILISARRPARLAALVSPMEAMRGTSAVMQDREAPVRRWHRLLGKVFGVNGIVAWRNLQRHRSQFNVTVLSMTICVALVIVFGFYVTAAQPEQVLQDQFPAEFVLSLGGINQMAGYTEQDLESIQRMKGVSSVYVTRERAADLTMSAEKLTPQFRDYFQEHFHHTLPQAGLYSAGAGLYGYSENILERARDYLTAGSIDIDRLAVRQEVLIVNSIRTEGGMVPASSLQVGDEVVLRTTGYEGNQVVYGPEQVFTVAGILSCYPFPMDMVTIGVGVVMHEDAFRQFTGSSICRRLDVQVSEDADRDSVQTALRSIAGKTSQGRLVSYQEQIQEMEEQKQQYSILLFSLIGIIVMISLFSIVNTISTNLLLRTREFGVLRAVGMTRKQLTATLRVEGLYYGLASSVWGAGAGNLLAWLLYIAVRSQATWLEWSLPWQSTLLACIGALAASVLATLGPVQRLSGMDVIDVIRRVY